VIIGKRANLASKKANAPGKAAAAVATWVGDTYVLKRTVAPLSHHDRAIVRTCPYGTTSSRKLEATRTGPAGLRAPISRRWTIDL